MKIIFQIDGGRGKCIAATAVCKAVKAQYPNDELIVVSGYPEVFLCNTNVDENLRFNELQYFWQRHISGQDPKMMLQNPYLEADFLLGKKHLTQIWCEMNGIKFIGRQPEVFTTNREQNFFGNQFGSPKPLMVIQTSGGAENQPNKYSWTRDLPQATAQQVVNAFANEYTIIHIRREDQLPLQNVQPMQADFRALAVLIQLSEKRLFIDSFAQHTAAALGRPSVVCMIDKTVETQFGYDMHNNIIAHPPTLKPELKHSFLSRYNITGNATEFPYHHEGEIYDADVIIEAIKKTPAQQITESFEAERTKQNGSAKRSKKEETVEQ
jgi:hypothetical protein